MRFLRAVPRGVVGRFGGCRCAAVRVTDCVRERGGPGQPAPGTEWPTSQRLGYAAGGRWVANRAVTVTVDREGGGTCGAGNLPARDVFLGRRGEARLRWAFQVTKQFMGRKHCTISDRRPARAHPPSRRSASRVGGSQRRQATGRSGAGGVLDCWNRKRREHAVMS